MKKALYKVPNGKLLKIFLEETNGKIDSLQITGDFFVYPEENIEKLEKFLISTPLSQEVLREKINEFIKNTGTTFFGIDMESLLFTILHAV